MGHGKVITISVAAGTSCHEITHNLRRGRGKVVTISVAAGTSCHEITHFLRRGHDKVVMISICSRNLMPRDHALAEKGT